MNTVDARPDPGEEAERPDLDVLADPVFADVRARNERIIYATGLLIPLVRQLADDLTTSNALMVGRLADLLRDEPDGRRRFEIEAEIEKATRYDEAIELHELADIITWPAARTITDQGAEPDEDEQDGRPAEAPGAGDLL